MIVPFAEGLLCGLVAGGEGGGGFGGVVAGLGEVACGLGGFAEGVQIWSSCAGRGRGRSRRTSFASGDELRAAEV